MHISKCQVGKENPQSAQVAVDGVHIIVDALVVQEKHHQRKLLVMPAASASEVFALIDGRINTISTSCRARVKTILDTSKNRMQQPTAACTRAKTLTRPCPGATYI